VRLWPLPLEILDEPGWPVRRVHRLSQPSRNIFVIEFNIVLDLYFVVFLGVAGVFESFLFSTENIYIHTNVFC
jgi:hypothetical protein